MHGLTVPADPNQTLPPDSNPVALLYDFFQQRIRQLCQKKIDPSRLILDPGIGFGKGVVQSWQLLRHISAFKPLGAPIMVGHSRKSFLNTVTNAPANQRDAATLGVSLQLMEEGVDFLRIHNVLAHREALSATKTFTHA